MSGGHDCLNCGVKVIGDSAASRAIRSALPDDRNNAVSVAIVADWPDIRSLQHLAKQVPPRWMLVEDCGYGRIALGPLFRLGYRGCFDCYIARRRSNSGGECRPASSISAPALAAIQAELTALAESRSQLASEQVIISADGTVETHAFIAVPDCPTCSLGLANGQDRTWHELVSDRLGLVHEVRDVPGLPDPMSAALAVGSRTDAFWSHRALNRGMAVDDDLHRARQRAVFESIERYCASFVPSNLPLARASDLDGPYLPPSRFGNSTTLDGDENSLVRWVRARSLAENGDIWVPASAVYVPYTSSDGESVVHPQCSVGLAAHKNLEDALDRGLWEVLERDECLRAWRFRLPVRKIPHLPIEMRGLNVVRVPSESGLQVVVCFLEGQRPPFTSTGLAARPDFHEATRHAIFEAMLSSLWLDEWLAMNEPTSSCLSPVRTMIDNAVAHAVREDLRSARLRWLKAPDDENEIGSGSLEINLSGSPGACYVEVTSSDVASAGIRVVRVLVPDKVLSDDDSLCPRIGGDSTPHPFG